MELVRGKTTHAPMALVDFAHTPDALEQTLKALRPIANQRSGKLWCVFGCGGDRDNSKRPLMGRIAEQFADEVMVTSDNPRSENPEKIITEILSGCKAVEKIQKNFRRFNLRITTHDTLFCFVFKPLLHEIKNIILFTNIRFYLTET